MKGVRSGASREDVVRLFEGESVAGLDEGELLDRFATRRDEVAFEALVGRLGPMVLGLCRRMLPDPHDVDDAFQATFLVLVRKAESIRDRDLVAPWLYGVALKVARRARHASARRVARERLAVVPEAVIDPDGFESGWPELRAVIDEEIGRLPEDHRRAVVLCDVEGLTREEAALRLGWSLNMVRGRLERARGRLRSRLVRRGVTPSGAWAAWMVVPPSPALLTSTTRAALAFSTGRMGAGLASASAVALSRGVLRMMMLSKWKLGLAALLSAGVVAGGSGLIAAQGPGGKPDEAATKGVDDPAKVQIDATRELYRNQTPPALLPQAEPGPTGSYQARSAADLARARIEMAMERYRAQLAFYQEGRITVDRLIDASRGLMQAKLDASDSKADRVGAVRVHYDRLKEILKREQAELEVGRATTADVAEINSALLEAEFALAKQIEAPESKTAGGDSRAATRAPAEAKPSLDQQRLEIARRLYNEARKLFPAEIPIDEFLEAAITLAKAEEGVARTGADRVAAARAQVDRLRQAVDAKERLVQANEARPSDVDRVRLRLLDAESHLLEVTAGPGEAIAPMRGGTIPVPVPETSGARKSEAPSPLAEAIALFNAEASMEDPALDRDHDPLTEDEVIAAIRYWQPDREVAMAVKGSNQTPPGMPIDAFKAIAESRRLPAGASLVLLPGEKDLGGEFIYYGLWVSLSVPSRADRENYLFPIREHLSGSLTLNEALKVAEDNLRRSKASPNKPNSARVEDLKSRIEWRSKNANPGR